MAKDERSKSDMLVARSHHEGHYYLRVPDLRSLYLPSKEFDAWKNELEDLLDLVAPRGSVSLLLSRCHDDWSLLTTHHLLSATALDHLIELRGFFAKLFAVRDRLELWAPSSVVDSYCELMLCCGRVWLSDPLGYVGFGEWEKGFAPLGGACELRCDHGLEKKSFWLKNTLFRVWQAPKNWQIRLASPDLISEWLDLYDLGAGLMDGAKPAPRFDPLLLGGSHLSLQDLGRMKDLLIPALNVRSTGRSEKKWQGAMSESLWDPFWRKDASSASESDELLRSKITCLIHGWHQVSLLGSAPGGLSSHDMELAESSARAIWVDASHIFAPLNLLLYWLSLDLALVFISLSKDNLTRRVEILRHRLLDIFSKEEVATILTRMRFLILSPEEYETITSTPHGSLSLVTFRKDGSLRVRSQGKREDFLRLSGNEFGADLGVVEAKADGSKMRIQHLFAERLMVCQMPGGIYGSVWLKAHFLKELCQHAWAVKGGLPAVLKLLVQQGWRLEEDEKDWALFMTAQTDVFMATASNVGLRLRWRLEEDFPWGMPWHQVVQWLRRYGFNQKADEPRFRVDELMSEHFMILAVVLSKVMYHEGWLAGSREVDEFVRHALGVPSRMGSLQHKSDMMGPEMLSEYALKHFPALRRLEGSQCQLTQN